jgi:heat shock protein HslJ
MTDQPNPTSDGDNRDPLFDTQWRLVELGGDPAPLGSGDRSIHLVMTSEEPRAHGFAGCNNFMGTFKTDGVELRFGPLATTMMACSETMELEREFLDVLASTNGYSIERAQLTLVDDAGTPLARFAMA